MNVTTGRSCLPEEWLDRGQQASMQVREARKRKGKAPASCLEGHASPGPFPWRGLQLGDATRCKALSRVPILYVSYRRGRMHRALPELMAVQKGDYLFSIGTRGTSGYVPTYKEDKDDTCTLREHGPERHLRRFRHHMILLSPWIAL